MYWGSKDAYLGQTPPTDTPQIFAPGLLAESGTFIMGRVAFSQDGKEFYYAQNDLWESDARKLKMMRFAHGHWNKPIIVGEQLLSPTFSRDGNTLFMRQGSMRNLWKPHVRGTAGQSPPSASPNPSASTTTCRPSVGPPTSAARPTPRTRRMALIIPSAQSPSAPTGSQ